MKTDDDQIVMYDSPEAATFRTGIEGWVSRNGIFCGSSEDAARYEGCTHRKCEDCGKPARKSYTHCEECRDARAWKRYESLETKPWTTEAMVYSDAFDEYFNDEDHMLDFADENAVSDLREMRLLHCTPVYAHQLDTDDWCDELPEDGDCPEWLEIAIYEFNEKLRAANEPLSYLPNNKLAVDVSAYAKEPQPPTAEGDQANDRE